MSIGFDKTWGQDAPRVSCRLCDYNWNKYRGGSRLKELKIFAPLTGRNRLAGKVPISRQYSRLLSEIVILGARSLPAVLWHPQRLLRVVRSAIDTDRFVDQDRTTCRRSGGAVARCATTKSLDRFAAMNYRLKGLDPLLQAVRCWCALEFRDRLAVSLTAAGNPRSSVIKNKLGTPGNSPSGDFRRPFPPTCARATPPPIFWSTRPFTHARPGSERWPAGCPVITTTANVAGPSELLCCLSLTPTTWRGR